MSTTIRQQRLPSPEICFNYTVAMFFAQQLELKLRAILHTASYWGLGKELELTQKEEERFKDSKVFIDDATCGALIQKLRKTEIARFKDGKEWNIFEKACEHRNELAHRFLAMQDFEQMSQQAETDTVQRLRSMMGDLYLALHICSEVLGKAEDYGQEVYDHWANEIGDFSPEWRYTPKGKRGKPDKNRAKR